MTLGQYTVRKNKAGFDPTKIPTPIDVAWAAGIYEGEGCCQKKGSSRSAFSVSVSQKDPELLYRLQAFFGGRVGKFKNGKFDVHRWVVCGDRSRIFLATIYPFMTARRKSQIDSTGARVFLEYVSDLLILPASKSTCSRYEAICEQSEEFNDLHRYKNKTKRAEYIRNWQNKKYQEDPEYREKRLAAKRGSKRSKQVQKLQVVEMKISA